MTTIPNPKTVREIARDAYRYLPHDYARARLVQAALAEHCIDEHDVPTWSAYFNAAKADLVGATVSWPDEQPQDERAVCGVQLPADSAQRLGASRDTKCARPDGHVAHDDGNGVLWVDRERAAQGESDGDVRPVAALLDVLARADQRNRPKVLHGPIADLRERFADRIAGLDARAAKAGEWRG